MSEILTDDECRQLTDRLIHLRGNRLVSPEEAQALLDWAARTRFTSDCPEMILEGDLEFDVRDGQVVIVSEGKEAMPQRSGLIAMKTRSEMAESLFEGFLVHITQCLDSDCSMRKMLMQVADTFGVSRDVIEAEAAFAVAGEQNVIQ